MHREIEIHPSNKRGFGGQESHIVTRGRTSYLRIIGNDPDYRLMTATADEDDRSFRVCSEKIKLVASAIKLRTNYSAASPIQTDSSGRRFILICAAKFDPKTQIEDLRELRGVIDEFFSIFDTINPAEPETVGEMKELYSIMSVDDSNDDVYLSDGVWLGSDGSLSDRGR